ncbi:MAG: transglutaminase TgpA family protein [Actinomycetota bacterium]
MGTEARARLGLAGLLFATLFSFELVFEGGDYVGPALLGMMIAFVVAVVVRRLGGWSFTTIFLSSGVLVWYLVLVFEARHTYYGLPTLQSLAGVFNAVTRAIEASRVDFAPAPLRPGYLVLTVAALWLATTVGEVATFRWKRPVVAAVVPLGLFSLLTIVGRGKGESFYLVVFLASLLTYWGLESSHRLRSWGRWMSAWSDRAAEEPRALTGSVARRMGATCLAAALFSPLLFPAIEDGLIRWRSGFGSGSGAGLGEGSEAGARIDLMVSIKPTLLTQSDLELFTVRSSSTTYWRLASLVEFDGVAWRRADGEFGSAFDGVRTNQAAPGRSLQQQIEITNLRGAEMPAAAQAETVVLVGSEGQQQTDVRYHVDTGELRLDGGLDRGVRYIVESVVPDPGRGNLRSARPGLLDDATYTTTPPVSESVTDLLQRWVAGSATPYERLVAIQNRLRNDYIYSEDVESSATNDHLTQFLTETRRGFCQQFSTAFALLARELGYASRVSVGFLPGEPSSIEQGLFIVRGTHAHAWPEVYFEEFGWVRFEPTPRDIAGPPSYTVPGTSAAAAGPGTGLGNVGNLGLPNNIPDDDALGRYPNVTGATGAGLGGEGQFDEGIEWRPAFRRLSTTLLILVIAFLVAVPLTKEWRTLRRYSRAHTPVGTAVAAFAHFQDEAAQLAARRPASESAIAYAARLASLRRVPAADATRLAGIYEAAQYSPVGLSSEQAAEARHLARSLRSRLWSRATWWERAIRLFSPAGLARP